MKTSEHDRLAVKICTIVAVLSGCGGLQSPNPAFVQPAASRAPVPLGNGNLLYASAFGAERIYVYSYPKGKAITSLRLTEPSGLCVDQANNVWVTGVVKVVEYAHGKKNPIATLANPGYGYSCSVNPKTGDLAVPDRYSLSNKRGFVAIYPQAQGTPTLYRIPNIARPTYCGYDGHGNLFVDGLEKGTVNIAELPSGGSHFRKIDLNQSIGYAGNIQWDGQYLAIGDAYSTTIYQFAIRGHRGEAKGSTPLGDVSGGTMNEFWIQGGMVTAAIQLPGSKGLGIVGLWNYPGGGSPVDTITGLVNPTGVAVSLAK